MVQFDRARLASMCREHGISRLRVFGSAARGEDRPDSDIDLIVDYIGRKGYFELVELEEELAKFFGREVDLVTERGLSPHMKEAVLASVTVLFDAES
jgi:predicted nucleotidyltransferase